MIYLNLNTSTLFSFFYSKAALFCFFALNTLICKGFEGDNKLSIGLNPTVESNISSPTSFKYNDANIVLETSANGSSISPTIERNGNPGTFTISPQQGVSIDADGVISWTNALVTGTHKYTVTASNTMGTATTSFTIKIGFSEIEKIKVKYRDWIYGTGADFDSNATIFSRYYATTYRPRIDLFAWDFSNPGAEYDFNSASTGLDDQKDFQSITQNHLFYYAMKYHLQGPSSQSKDYSGNQNTHYKSSDLLQKILDIFDYLKARGINDQTAYKVTAETWYGRIGYHYIGRGNLLRLTSYAHAVFLMREELKKAGKFDHHMAALKHATDQISEAYGNQLETNPLKYDGQDADLVRSLANSKFAYILAQDDTDPSRSTNMDFFVKWMNNACQIGVGWSDFIKPDGLTWHHRGPFPVSYGEGALTHSVIINYMLNGTPYQLNDQSRTNLKKAVMASSRFTNGYEYPISVTGRFPNNAASFSNTFPLFAYTYLTDPANNEDAGKEFIRYWNLFSKTYADAANPTQSLLDKILRSSYNAFNVFQTIGEAKLMDELIQSGKLSAATTPSGSFSFPYAGLSIHRRDNWMAAIKGTSKHIWQAETYEDDNKYGRYISAGHIELLTNNSTSNEAVSREHSRLKLDGWDWSRYPGTTVTYLTQQQNDETARKARPQDLTRQVMLSLASLDDQTTFALHYEDIQSPYPNEKDNHNPDERQQALKSVFGFDDVLLFLGSGIKNGDGQNPVQTTLFQTAINNDSANDPNHVDGTSYTSLNNSLSDSAQFNKSGGGLWLTDTAGNGYVLPQSDKNNDMVYMKRSRQTFKDHKKNDQTGQFATAWIDHGNNPDNDTPSPSQPKTVQEPSSQPLPSLLAGRTFRKKENSNSIKIIPTRPMVSPILSII